MADRKVYEITAARNQASLHPSKRGTDKLDPEWLEVLQEVIDSGISKEEFRLFLLSKSSRKSQKS